MPHAKGGRILVVDDEPMVRETLGEMLSEEGYVVDLAVDGTTALECVQQARPDAILLDLMMPGMNGRQFLQALREDPDYVTVPVLIMTAVHGLNVNLATLGASDLVEKPFIIEELLNKVALAVYRSRGEEGTTASLPAPPQPPVVPKEERPVVLIVEHDRARMQGLDLLLSTCGYTVVSMTRALVQLSRLARALRPRAILLDLASEGARDVAGELRTTKELEDVPLLVFARGAGPEEASHDALAYATDAQLLEFVKSARP